MLISRASRLKYNFSADFFRPDGHVIFPDLASARAFASQMSAHHADPVPATDLYALSLLDEAYHILLKYFYSRYTGVMGRAMGVLQSNLGSKYDLTLTQFTVEFPPMSVFRGEVTAGMYLSTNIPHFGDFGRGVRAATIEEMLLINNANNNPAVNRYKNLIDESVMTGSAYKEVMQLLLNFFVRQPGFGNGEYGLGETLMDVLAAPIKASPDSLEGQLRFVIDKWGYLLGESFSVRMLRGLDYLREEIIRKGQGPIDSQKAEKHVPNFAGSDYAEYERYSPDKDWMPRLVLLAKNTYVWLGQLSKKYQRDITTLDQIPDEELDLLASRGFTGLWLIGLWERSRASQRIKQRMGQDDAVASAYSLDSYDIADDLGDWNALNKRIWFPITWALTRPGSRNTLTGFYHPHILHTPLIHSGLKTFQMIRASEFILKIITTIRRMPRLYFNAAIRKRAMSVISIMAMMAHPSRGTIPRSWITPTRSCAKLSFK